MVKGAQGPAHQVWSRFAGWVKDALVPSMCPCCKTTVLDEDTLCQSCWEQVHFLDAPLCQRCGVPFSFSSDVALQCGACLRRPPPYKVGRTVVAYNETTKKIVLPFKHGDATYLGSLMARWAVQRHPDLFAGADIIIPVPLHWRRLFKRQYNQAAVWGQYLSKLTQISHRPLLLQRISYTPSQGGLSAQERRENVRNVFHVTSLEALRDKTVVLIDDVLTTGATLEACCKALRESDMKELRVLTFARVLRSSAFE